MESVLKDFTKKCRYLRNYSYCERLRKFGLMLQERHVERYKILYLRKILIRRVLDLGVRAIEESRMGPIF